MFRKLAFLSVLAATWVGSAMAQVTLPPTGIDVSAYITVIVSTLGGILATVIGAVFAFMVIRKSMRYMWKIG